MLYLEQLKSRYKLIIGYVGTIVLGTGFALLLPLLVIPVYESEVIHIPYFLIPAVIAIIIGILLRTFISNNKDVTLTLQEGGVIVLLSWFITIIISALPFILSGKLNFTQAIFESVSGWTTTGLSVVDVTKTPNVFLLWRSLMQFFGGAGLAVVMLSAIIGPHGLGLYNAEGRSDRLLPNVTKSTKLIMTIYLSYVIAGTILYIIAGMNWFDAVNHSMAALSTGGFSTKPDSIGAFNNLAIELITIILMILGTINFAAHFILLKGKIKDFFRIGEIRFLFVLISLFIPIIAFISLKNLYGILDKTIRIAAFETISAISTTGFSTVGYNNWNVFGVFMLIVLMIIGGGTGSTAGGIKQYRIYVMIKSVIWNIKSYLMPKRLVRQNYVVRPEGRYYVNENHLIEISNFIFIYAVVYFLGVAVLLANGYSLKESMFEFASSLGTVGLSLGVTSADASLSVLWAEIIGMILGRLEFFVVFFSSIKLIKDVRFIIKSRK